MINRGKTESYKSVCEGEHMCLTAHFFPDICFGTLLEVVTGSLGMTKGEGKWQFSLEGSSVQGTGDG